MVVEKCKKVFKKVTGILIVLLLFIGVAALLAGIKMNTTPLNKSFLITEEREIPPAPDSKINIFKKIAEEREIPPAPDSKINIFKKIAEEREIPPAPDSKIVILKKKI